ncbi:MAG: hypothetical protein ABIE70_11570 [bacterium]
MNRKSASLLALTILLALSTVQAQSVLPKPAAAPDSGYTSNAATDVALHGGGIWMATDEGAQVTYDQGQTWLRIGQGTGLISEIVSAIYSSGTRLWMGTSHSQMYDGGRYAYSDGVSFSDDNGTTWHHIDFSESGQNIDWVSGVSRTVFDITGHIDEDQDAEWVVFAAFAGGFLASRDGGLNWRRIFPTTIDSVQFVFGGTPSERNRAFSCVADTSRGDTLYLWTGTAEGIFQYIFATPKQKPHSKHINRIAFCDECPDSSWVFYGGHDGFTRGLTTGRPYISRLEEDGLPGPAISALIDFRGRLLVATYDDATDLFTGLAWSDDRGESFQSDDHPVTSYNGRFAGGEALVTDFAAVRERLYLAGGANGLFVSSDSGLTWDDILVDSSAASSLLNSANALFADGDTLLVGTDSGLASLFLDPLGVIDSSRFHVFGEFDSSAFHVGSTRVMRVRVQKFSDDDTGELDSMAYWTVNQPLTSEGRRMVGRNNPDSSLWNHYQWRAKSIDVNFIGDTAIVMGEDGIWFTSDGGNPGAKFAIEEHSGGNTVDSFGNDVVTTMEVMGDTVAFGSNNGFAISTNRGADFDVVRVNTDPLKADLVIHHLASQTAFEGLTGDFVPALDVQYVDGQPARVWASNRSTAYWPDSNAISVGQVMEVDADGEYVPLGSADSVNGYVWVWDRVYNKTFAWNHAFYGDSVFAATDSGLVLLEPNETATVWTATEIPLENENGEPWLAAGTSVYGVEVQPPYLWVGTDDRTLRLRLDDLGDQTVYQVIDSTTPPDEVYAFPVPYSHAMDGASGGLLDFHFVLDRPADVTITVYDFAMNKVATVIENQPFPAGIYPSSGSLRPRWNGINDKGDQGAVGVYYFKVEYSTGETYWGKLALIP